MGVPVEGWAEVAERVMNGRAEKAWVSRYPSASAWLEDLARTAGRTPGLLRRWAAGLAFVRAVAGKADWPSAGELRRLDFGRLELVARAYALHPERALHLCRDVLADRKTKRDLEAAVVELAKSPAAPGPRRKGRGTGTEAALRKNWRGIASELGYRMPLVPLDWPAQLGLPAPDMMLENPGELCIAFVATGPADDQMTRCAMSWALSGGTFVDQVWLVLPAGSDHANDLTRTLTQLAAPNVGVAVLGTPDGVSTTAIRQPVTTRRHDRYALFQAMIGPDGYAARRR